MTELFQRVDGTAVLSHDRIYRYELWRRWRGDDRTAVFIGLNPSTADETKDDPTIRKCVGFAKRWGFGALGMLNLFAFRATQPKDMKQAADPVGPDNDETIRRVTSDCAVVVAAWGKDGSHLGRDKEVAQIISAPMCLRLNGDRSPGHPLYIPYEATLTPFRP